MFLSRAAKRPPKVMLKGHKMGERERRGTEDQVRPYSREKSTGTNAKLLATMWILSRLTSYNPTPFAGLGRGQGPRCLQLLQLKSRLECLGLALQDGSWVEGSESVVEIRYLVLFLLDSGLGWVVLVFGVCSCFDFFFL